MRKLLDGHNVEERDAVFQLMASSDLFHLKKVDGDTFLSADYNQTMEDQRAITMKRALFLRDRGLFKGWLSRNDPDFILTRAAQHECLNIFDHSLAIKLGVHFHLW